MGSTTVFCIDCGAANPLQANYCFACGEPVKTDQQASGNLGHAEQLKTGEVLKQRYQIQGQIGQGGFGAVYKAEDQELGQRLVAIKEMSLYKRNSQEIQEGVEAFKHEALMLAGLKHEHLPRIYEHFSENERWYLVMDYIAGETLESRFEKSRDGSLPLVMALQIALQLCEVLGYLHTRQPPIIFRDLKPSNIILTPEGSLFLIDFGIARHFKPGQAKDTIAFGSPGYAAPEQYGKAQTTPRADIYSLGSILHQMLSGHDPSLSPFRYISLHGHPPLLEDLVSRMLQMDEQARPADINEVKQVLQTVRDHPGKVVPSLSGGAQTGQILPAMPVTNHLLAAMPGAQAFSMSGTSAFPILPIAVVPAVPLQVHQHHYGLVRAVAWAPDSNYAASATDAIVRVWDVRNAGSICCYQEHKGNIKHMAWSPVAMRIASVSEDNKIHIWDGQSGKTISVLSGVQGVTHALAWSPDGRSLASAGNGSIVIWDIEQDKITQKLRRGLTNFIRLSWSADSKYLAAANGNYVLIWRPGASRSLKTRFYHYSGRIMSVAWSPNGIYLAFGGTERTVQVWNTHTNQLVGVYPYHVQAVSALSWAPDSRHIVSGSYAEHINIWDAMTGWNIASYRAHAGMITAVAWSPNGKLILSGGSDRRVCIWRAP